MVLTEVTNEHNLDPSSPCFTGIARSVVCYMHRGDQNHPIFRIATLHIENGTVIKKELSDYHAQWECGSKMDLANDKALLNLNNEWEEFKAFQK